MQVTMDFLCGQCREYTRFLSPLEMGKNSVAVTCSHCGERWHVTYDILSMSPLTVGDWEIKRWLGVMRDAKFFSKETLQ